MEEGVNTFHGQKKNDCDHSKIFVGGKPEVSESANPGCLTLFPNDTDI